MKEGNSMIDIKNLKFTNLIKTNTKLITLISVLLAMAVLTSCSTPSVTQNNSSDTSENSSSSAVTPYANRTLVKIATLKGPTGMGMVKMISDNEEKITSNRYEVNIVGAPDEIVGKISTGEIDIAAVPTNLAATLYNKTNGGVQILAINTLGVLNILEKGDTIKNISDLKGKTIVTSGKGASPEFILNYLLEQNGIDPEKDLTIEYKSEHSEVMTLALSGKADIVMLPEPFVTTALSKSEDFRNALDLTEEWAKVTEKIGVEGSVLAMGCVVVRKEFAQENEQAVNDFLNEYNNSINFTNSSQSQAADLIAKYEIIPSAALAKMAIPNSNITFVEGLEMKNQISNLYDVLFLADPKSIGGKMPESDFYYIR